MMSLSAPSTKKVIEAFFMLDLLLCVLDDACEEKYDGHNNPGHIF